MPFRPIAALSLMLLGALPAHADVDARFDLSVRGVTGGQIAIRGRDGGGSYSVSAAAQATGLVGSLVKYGFEGQAQGRVSGGRYVPSVYSETEDDDGEITSSVTRFRGGRPQSVSFDPPRERKDYDIDPRSVSGVMDPLTALYAVMSDVDPSGACNARYDLFDGRHVSRMSLGAPQAGADGRIVCAGEYRRIAGYSADDMAEDPVVPLTFTYGPAGGGKVHVTEIRSPTGYGDAVLRRR